MQKPFLQGTSCDLRALQPEDANERYLSWFHDAETCRYNTHHRFPMTAQTLQAYVQEVSASKTAVVLAIVEKESERHVGNIALQGIDPIARTAELAILIGEEEARGKGIGREACALMIRHGFLTLGLNRIWLGTMATNTGMRRVAEALGFTQEGVLRQANYTDGTFVDGVIYGLLATDPQVS
jgi:RimJ/RimL family protein N-acetyltransferase